MHNPMDTFSVYVAVITIVIAIGGLLLQCLAMVAGGVWIVSRINTIAENLIERLDSLKEWVKDLDQKMEKTSDEVAEMRGRQKGS